MWLWYNDHMDKNFTDFKLDFGTEEQCIECMFKLRWRWGYFCSRCGCDTYWKTSNGKYECEKCRYQTSITTNTILHGTRLSLYTWFYAIWYISSSNKRISINGLERELGTVDKKTVRKMFKKIERALLKFNAKNLQGIILAKKITITTPDTKKVDIFMAIEADSEQMKLCFEEDSSVKTFNTFIDNNVEKDSTIITSYEYETEELAQNYKFINETAIDEKVWENIKNEIEKIILSNCKDNYHVRYLNNYLNDCCIENNKGKEKSDFLKLLYTFINLPNDEI